MDEHYLNSKRFGKTVPGLLKTDRAVIYAKQQLQAVVKEIDNRTTKTIGDSYYRLARIRRDLLPFFEMSGEVMLVEKFIELTSPLGLRTNRQDAIHKLDLLVQYLDTYQTFEEEEIASLKQKIDKLEQQLFEKSEDEIVSEDIDISDDKSVFVIMPFNKEFNDVWKGGIERAAKTQGFRPIRVDMINKSSNITDDIIDSIKNCKIAIVDVSTNNPNVMFELGYGIALDKPNIIISQSVEFLPFDIRNIRTIVYANTWSGIEELNMKIQEFLKDFKPKFEPKKIVLKKAAKKR